MRLKNEIENQSFLKTKMRTTPYHYNLLSDRERLAAFYEAIKENARGTVYDIGAGCGILSSLASSFADFVYAVEIDPSVAKLAESNLKSLDNVFLINKDAREVSFPKKADLIICEMLDTALIDEEQVPVINSILKYLKKDGEVIPKRALNGAEAVYMERNNICYDDDFESLANEIHEIMSDLVIYNEINFKNEIKEDIEADLNFEIYKKGIISGIKITTFTLLTDDIICGPTPMLNPPLLIPIEKINVDIGDLINVKLSYRMGGGLNSIRIKAEKIS